MSKQALGRIVAGWGVVAAVLCACGCAPKTLVVLTTYPDRPTGAVTVSNSGGAVDIATANHFTTVKDSATAPAPPAPMDDARIRTLFGKVLAMEPPAPEHFLLYFASDSTDLTADSAALLPAIAEAIRRRGSETVSVVGHSDTWGDRDYNLKLSLRRAETIKARLVSMGIAESSFHVSGHGSANPVVPTGPNVKEERNRRVEVVVR